MKTLYLITARGGSKGIPNKNIRPLNGKPLLFYSIDIARTLADDIDICLSTDDVIIRQKAETYGLKVPFMRPGEFATDTAGSYEVILHALNHYKLKGIDYQKIILLQPTSPFRTTSQILEADALYSEEIDMVVSVAESKANPYYNLFEEDDLGFLVKSKKAQFHRRQDAPKIWLTNGSIYIINSNSLINQHMNEFSRIRKYVMSELYSMDLDTESDWELAEYMGKKYGL